MVLSFDRWVGKVAIVTGASTGIGAATVKKLVEEGVKVVGVARRSELIEELSKKLAGKKGKLYAFKADFSKEEDILKTFKWTTENLGPVSILVNNAAIYFHGLLLDGSTDQWRASVDLNILGLCIATREAIKSMKENNIDGHIININSVVGHKVVLGVNFYSPTKFAVTAITETLRLELNSLKSKIKTTSLSPGGVDTPFVLGGEELSEDLQKLREFLLQPEDVADAIAYALSTPSHVQIQELTIKPVGETI